MAVDLFGALDALALKFKEEHSDPKGFNEKPRPLHTDFMLFVSEIAEAFEDERKGITQSEKIPEFTAIEEEMADVVIRVLDQAAVRGWRIGGAVRAKHAYNMTRERKHGKKF